MGQATSTGEELNIHPMQKLQAHLDVLSTVATLTYPEFLRSIDEINNMWVAYFTKQLTLHVCKYFYCSGPFFYLILPFSTCDCI